MNLGIIADDFTGANDVALQLSKYGIKIESLIELKDMPKYFVYSTETRNAKEKDAREKLEITYKNLKMKNGELQLLIVLKILMYKCIIVMIKLIIILPCIGQL